MSNMITIAGRVASPQFKPGALPKDSVLNFSLADNLGKDKAGNERTNWFKVAVWGEVAAKLAPYLTSGTPVTTFGKLSTSEYTDRDGNKRFSLDVTSYQTSLQGSKPEGSTASPSYPPSAHTQSAPAQQTFGAPEDPYDL